MKKPLLLLPVFAAGLIAPALAVDTTPAIMMADGLVTIDEILDNSRLSVGASRDSVLNQLRPPNLISGPEVWIYTGFRAKNVVNTERYDTLVVTFKQDRVASIKLAKEEHVRVAAARSGVVTPKIAKR